MPIASTRVEGIVPGIAGARAITVSAIRMMERAIRRGVGEDQTNAFAVGGHHLHGGHKWQEPSALAIRLGTSSPLVRTGKMSGMTRVWVDLKLLPTGIQFDIRAYNLAPYAGYQERPTFNHWTGRYNPVRLPVEFTAQDLIKIRELIEGYMLRATSVKTVNRVKKGGISRVKNVARRILSFFIRGGKG